MTVISEANTGLDIALLGFCAEAAWLSRAQSQWLYSQPRRRKNREQSMTSAEDVLGFYDEDYLYFAQHTLGRGRTQNEVSFIWHALSLSSGDSVLDLGCGHGRIANGLAERGARVTSLEVLPKFVERAREDATRKHLSVDYRYADIREPISTGPFDATVLWFYSFGYHSDQENLGVLRNISRALKAGGKLLFDQYNVSALARAADHYSVLDFGSSLLIQKPICDLDNRPMRGQQNSRSRWCNQTLKLHVSLLFGRRA